MTFTPNTQITQENVGLLKAGDVLRRNDGRLCTVHPEHDPFDVLVYFHAFDEEVGGQYQGHATPESFTYIGPDLGDGWIGWAGGENPVPGMRVDVRWAEGIALDGNDICENEPSSDWNGDWESGDIIAFRPALSPPAEGSDPFYEVSDEKLPGMKYAEPGWLARSLEAAKSEVSSKDVFATPTPAEGEHWADRQIESDGVGGYRYATPTPPSVDWSVVGPKLVEAVKDLRALIDRVAPEYSESTVSANADAALAAAQPGEGS